MIYAKKLIVLSGIGGKGAVTLERSAAGLECRLATYNLPDLRLGNYVLAVFSDKTAIYDIGKTGKTNVRIKLDSDTRIDGIHFAVAECGSDVKIRLYGTNATTAMWEGNMADLIRRKTSLKTGAAALPEYSGRRKLEDYFYDIFPTSGDYRDNAVASVNFYSPDFAPDEENGTNFKHEASGMENERGENSAREARGEDVRGKSGTEYERRDAESPSELEKRYILRLMSLSPSVAERRDERGGQYGASVQSERGEIYGAGAAVQSERGEIYGAGAAVQSERGEIYDAGAAVQSEHGVPEAKERQRLKKAAASGDIPKAGSAAAGRTRKASFFEQAAPQIEKLFKENPRYGELEKLLPDTRWVRVDFDGRNYYAVGLIGARPDYVGYAVPAVFTKEPPEELDGYAVWVPRDPTEPEKEGFWVMYQDAVTGKSVGK